MSDDMTIEVNFSRDLKASNESGSTSAGMKLTYNVPLTASTEDIIEAAKEQYCEIKALIFTELGLVFNQDSVTGAVVEVFPGAVPVADYGTPSGPPQLKTVVDNTLVGPAPEPQQNGNAHLGQHVVPPTGEQDIQGLPTGQALPDPSRLTEWNDQCWYMLLTEPQGWVDNRGGRKSDKFPDFTAKDKNQFPEKGILGSPRAHGLYLNSQYGPPAAWVMDNMHLIEGRVDAAGE